MAVHEFEGVYAVGSGKIGKPPATIGADGG
jgi:hypothetical protein